MSQGDGRGQGGGRPALRTPFCSGAPLERFGRQRFNRADGESRVNPAAGAERPRADRRDNLYVKAVIAGRRQIQADILSGDDWVQSALALPLDSAPGRTFQYSSVSSYLVSVVLTRATGMSMSPRTS